VARMADDEQPCPEPGGWQDIPGASFAPDGTVVKVQGRDELPAGERAAEPLTGAERECAIEQVQAMGLPENEPAPGEADYVVFAASSFVRRRGADSETTAEQVTYHVPPPGERPIVIVRRRKAEGQASATASLEPADRRMGHV